VIDLSRWLAKLPPADRLDAAAKLVLRVAVGGLMLPHGIFKLFDGLEYVRTKLGLTGPLGALAYAVYIGEVLAPILMVLGCYARGAGLLLAMDMVVAIFSRRNEITSLRATGGWALEVDFLFLVGGVVVALLGPGPYVLCRRKEVQS
jgi:putative oxidoreductase